MNELECVYCGRIAKNRNSELQHRCRCSLNPDRKVQRGGRSYSETSWNKGLTKETSEKLKEWGSRRAERYEKGEIESFWKGKTLPESAKKKISEKMKGNRNANHRGDRQTHYKGIRMDSRWEAATAYYFDKIKVKWVYNERGFRLSDGRYYYPDFFLYRKNGEFSHLIEVKGYFRESNRLKFEQFKKEYPKVPITLWRQDKLRQLGLLDRSGYSIVNGE